MKIETAGRNQTTSAMSVHRLAQSKKSNDKNENAFLIADYKASKPLTDISRRLETCQAACTNTLVTATPRNVLNRKANVTPIVLAPLYE